MLKSPIQLDDLLLRYLRDIEFEYDKHHDLSVEWNNGREPKSRVLVTRFSDLNISVIASGCPVQVIKTIPISSPCPLPVVVSGSSGAVSATVNTVDVQIVCSDLGQIFRREINDTSGTPTKLGSS
jgi:hypothetical protein